MDTFDKLMVLFLVVCGSAASALVAVSYCMEHCK